ncbi:hypothetical protein [Halospeciosus flavus]|uniref:Uncharacterized protein n=1 Tax=Halospeciosus flavus TaxID=3032283 RepID=A0ABD5Z982_9EURY|nr:hypothetical protein [Halospeciosus flavus]
MIVVATNDFEVYHEVVNALRDRDVEFTTVEPGTNLPEEAEVVVTAESESGDGAGDTYPGVHTVVADPDDPRKAVEEALAYMRGGTGQVVVGVDPGPNPGIAVLHGGMVVATYQVPVEDAADVVLEEVADVPDPVVRVGDGARLHGARVIDALGEAGVTVELVDETGTTPYLGRGARNMDDVLAAVNIAHLEGERVSGRSVEPTAGELQVIKNRSRERSEENRTLPERLARQVATGELTLDEAIAAHREEIEE